MTYSGSGRGGGRRRSCGCGEPKLSLADNPKAAGCPDQATGTLLAVHCGQPARRPGLSCCWRTTQRLPVARIKQPSSHRLFIADNRHGCSAQVVSGGQPRGCRLPGSSNPGPTGCPLRTTPTQAGYPPRIRPPQAPQPPAEPTSGRPTGPARLRRHRRPRPAPSDPRPAVSARRR